MGATSHPEALDLRPVITAVRWLLVAFVVLTAIAALDLYLFSASTDRFFAWTVQPPLTAAFMGAGYAAGCTISLLALRERTWARIRLPFVVVWLFAVLTLGATILHLDRFHLAAPGALARTAAVVWLAVYVVVPVAMTALLPVQVRTHGGDPVRGRALPPLLRGILAVQGAAMLGVGVALYVAPAATAPLWPWELSPLTGRSVAAWLVALGAAALLAVRDDDLLRLGAPLLSYAVFGALQLGALARFAGDLEAGSPSVWVYALAAVSVLAVGLYGVAVARRASGVGGGPPAN